MFSRHRPALLQVIEPHLPTGPAAGARFEKAVQFHGPSGIERGRTGWARSFRPWSNSVMMFERAGLSPPTTPTGPRARRSIEPVC